MFFRAYTLYCFYAPFLGDRYLTFLFYYQLGSRPLCLGKRIIKAYLKSTTDAAAAVFRNTVFMPIKEASAGPTAIKPKKRKEFKAVIFFVINKKQQSRAAAVQA